MGRNEANRRQPDLALLVEVLNSGALTRRDAEICVMLMDDYNPKSIARALGLSQNAARVALHRLLKKLKTLIDPAV